MRMEIHEAANIFPIDEEHIAELGRDISANGQVVPIELFDGKVIDGRRRLRACELAGVEPKFTNVKPSDPVAYVLSLNLHRRHLSPAQLAMVGARAREVYDRQAQDRLAIGQKSGGRGHKKENSPANLPESLSGDARDAVGKVVGVGGKSIDYATKVLQNGIPELAKAVDDGRMAISTAAILSTEPPEKQLEEINRPARNRKYIAGEGTVGIRSQEQDEDKPETTGEIKGKGVIIANEAINCLARIPKNDALRKRGFQIVMDWIKANK